MWQWRSLRWYNPQIAILTKKVISNELAWTLQKSEPTNQPTNPDLAMGIKVEGYEGSGA